MEPNTKTDLFDVHMLNADGKAKANNLRDLFTATMREIENIVGGGEGRDLAIVRTKLQEASFFAKRAMAVQPQNQEPTS